VSPLRATQSVTIPVNRTMSDATAPTDCSGALTLLRECVGGRSGEKLLIVSEAEEFGCYDAKAISMVASAARFLGMVVYETQAGSSVDSDAQKTALLNTVKGFDHVVFFSRVGDQIRFVNNAQIPSSTMCYTLCGHSLNSQFGTACHYGMAEIKDAIDTAFNEAAQVKVTCPRGTHYVGSAKNRLVDAVEVGIKRFPLLVPKPIPAMGFSGEVALSRFLIGTGSKYYEPYCLPLPSDVFAHVEANRIIEFKGSADDVARVEQHYKHVSNQFGIEPWFVDSWHAGIHPACEYADDAEKNVTRWSNSVFGNPRVLHFHTCGEYAPGEISWHVIDPTIYVDGTAIWEDGRLYPERLPQCADILVNHPNLANLFANPTRQIGLSA